MGIETKDITWVSTVDTDNGMRDCVQTDSAVSFLQSEVLVLAAQELKKKLIDLAAEKLEIQATSWTLLTGSSSLLARNQRQRIADEG